MKSFIIFWLLVVASVVAQTASPNGTYKGYRQEFEETVRDYMRGFGAAGERIVKMTSEWLDALQELFYQRFGGQSVEGSGAGAKAG